MFVGAVTSVIAFTLVCVGSWPSGVIRWPKYLTFGSKNAHFYSLSLIPAISNLAKASPRFSRCSLLVLLVTSIISSRYTQTFDMPCSNVSMVLWKMAGATDTPNNRQLYLYNPLLLVIVVEKVLSPASEANKSSILGEDRNVFWLLYLWSALISTDSDSVILLCDGYNWCRLVKNLTFSMTLWAFNLSKATSTLFCRASETSDEYSCPCVIWLLHLPIYPIYLERGPCVL